MTMFRTLTLGLAVAATLALPVAAQSIDSVVSAARADVGKDIGGGITLLGVEGDAERLRFGFRYVATVAQIEAIGRQAFEDGFTNQFVAGLCGNPAVPPFVSGGGAIEVTMIDPNGETLIARRVTSC